MRARLLMRRICGPAAAVAVAAAGLQVAGVFPVQAMARTAHQVRTRDHRESADLVLRVRLGAKVTIKGGGGGTSNCTKDETDKTVTASQDPFTETISFIAKNSGSCAFERSWSDFDVQVADSSGVVIAATTVRLAGQSVINPYQAYCPPWGEGFRMTCRKTDDRRLELTQTAGLGTKSGGGLEKAQLNFFVGGPGPEIKVEGGGGGWDNSNCTNDETRTTVTAGDDPTIVPISFVAKSSGSCAIERSFSYFNIKISGTSRSGKSVRGEARILFGQDYAGEDYKVTCISTSPSVSCDKVGMRTLQLRYS
jgi:hypothetical protein